MPLDESRPPADGQGPRTNPRHEAARRGWGLPGAIQAENTALRASIRELTDQIRDLEAVNTEHAYQAGRWLPALLEAAQVLEETTRATEPYRWGGGQHDVQLDAVWSDASAVLRRLREVVDPSTATDSVLVEA